ncbi:MAG: sulfatase [Candidatus Paceibacterota bacterium]
MMKYLSALVIALVACHVAVGEESRAPSSVARRPFPTEQTGGLLGERFALWRTGRMPWMLDAEDEYLLKYLDFAEHIVAMSEAHQGLRLIGKDLHGTAPSEWLEPNVSPEIAVPSFRVKNSEIQLGPFYSAGSTSTGPRTYFSLVPPGERSRKTRVLKTTESKEDLSEADEHLPNIVFFLVDDLGWADLGCYGSSFYDTPNIDGLARQGVRFTDAYATCHVCSPSRASILTGKYPARLKLTDWLPGRKDFPFQRLANAPIHQSLPLEETTVAEALKKHGYRTGHFGKWHLGEAPAGPLRQGFDVQVPSNWFKGWPKAGYHAPFKFDGLDGERGDYLTDRLTEEAIQFIDDNRNQPFFLYLSHFAVHDPIQGRRDLVKKYAKRRSRFPSDEKPFALEGNPDAETSFTAAERDQMIQEDEYAAYRVLPNQMVKIKQRQDNPQFAAMVETVDESLGRVIAKLEALGLEQDTIIIFTSDNGGMAAANFGRPERVIDPTKLDAAYSTSNLPLRGAKGFLYEGGIRVPLIIKWPGKSQAASVIDEPVTGTDYYPTILDMIGVAGMPDQHLDGVSLAPLVRGETTTLGRDAIYWHFPHYSNHGMQSPGGAIRRGRYKLLEYFENGTVELFDLKADPGEQNNLAETHPEIAEQLVKELHQWRDATGAEMMNPNPDFDAGASASDGIKE